MSLLLLAETAAEQTGGKTGMGPGILIIYIVIIAFMIYLMFAPQKKQRKQLEELRKAMEPGDNIMTTGGFYGTILDITEDDVVIVEFGNNKNCRIPMHKNAIAEVEKAGSAVVKDDEPEEEVVEKKSKKKDKASKEDK